MNEWNVRPVLALGAILLVLSGCSARRAARTKAGAPTGSTPGAEGSATGGFTPGVDVTEASIRGSEFVEIPSLEPVYFELDSFSLKGDAITVLSKNAEYLKTRRDLEVLVAGHCDDRGTTAYNLALGQKRAKEVRESYIRLGVAGKSLATISYGEEKPSCSEATEACWAKNRRAATSVRAQVATSSNGEGRTQ